MSLVRAHIYDGWRVAPRVGSCGGIYKAWFDVQVGGDACVHGSFIANGNRWGDPLQAQVNVCGVYKK